MIGGLAPVEQAWLKLFFSDPNGVDWAALESDTLPPPLADQIRPWLQFLARGAGNIPIILPFVRNGETTGWYATMAGAEGGYELGAEIEAWLGPSYLNIFEAVPATAGDTMAAAMRDRFGGLVFRFTGADAAAITAITGLVADYAGLLQRRPAIQRRNVRPVGSIRADFERALLAHDEARAESMIAELRDTGRLNEENLHYLDVRLKAGLGLWPQIARNHWLVATMSDLALPPQILADILEALYRTYVEDIEERGELFAIMAAFHTHVVRPYPRLFASRRGIRTPRVVKAFLLYERLQARPDPVILNGLFDLLSEADRQPIFLTALAVSDPTQPDAARTEADAEEAFDDAQYDRAFEAFIALPLSKRSISRLLYCVTAIGTEDAIGRLLAALDGAGAELIAGLTANMREKIDGLREKRAEEPRPEPAEEVALKNPWIRWAEQLRDGVDLKMAEASLATATTTWDAQAIADSPALSKQFADLLDNLDGDAALLARLAVPEIFGAFFQPGALAAAATKPIAKTLFMLIVMDESLSRVDLDLLAQLLSHLLEFGLTADEYTGLIGDLDSVQSRVISWAHFPWSLDVSEILAIAPAPSPQAREARLRFFLQLIGQAQAFAHRLGPPELIPMAFLAQDYGIESDVLEALHRTAAEHAPETSLPDLAGKTIGIYTLAESAGSRAKQALEEMFPECRVEVNSDTVCTAQLTNLAATADIFVFAWKSSSHAAFYCVKNALRSGNPIWAQGKGTASIVRAAVESFN